MQEPSALWRRRARPLLGTYVEIAVPARDDGELQRWTEPAFGRIAEFHAAMSFHSPTSDLAAIARARADDSVRVSADTWTTLRRALELEIASDGIFNVAVAPELVRRGLLPYPPGAAAEPAGSALAALRLEPEGHIRLLAPVWIDLGGIAKGAAVDAAIDALRQSGAPSALVNAGGDLRAFGPEEHTVWVRRAAEAGGPLAVARVSDGAFATSGSVDADGRAHLVHRARTTPWPECRSISVAAPLCVMADALTKVVALAGPGSRPILERYDAQAVWIDADGHLHRV